MFIFYILLHRIIIGVLAVVAFGFLCFVLNYRRTQAAKAAGADGTEYLNQPVQNPIVTSQMSYGVDKHDEYDNTRL